MSTISTTKQYTFPGDTRHALKKSFFGNSNEMEVYYSGGIAYVKSLEDNPVDG